MDLHCQNLDAPLDETAVDRACSPTTQNSSETMHKTPRYLTAIAAILACVLSGALTCQPTQAEESDKPLIVFVAGRLVVVADQGVQAGTAAVVDAAAEAAVAAVAVGKAVVAAAVAEAAVVAEATVVAAAAPQACAP